jgi:hypothetical protein
MIGGPAKMRKRFIGLILLAIAGATFIAWVVAPRSAAADRLTVSFTGREPGVLFQAAGFYVTNCGNGAILLQQVEVQTGEEASWKTVSRKPPEVQPESDPGSSLVNYTPHLEAGEHRKIVVEWPEDRPWRVCIFYAPERKGLDALAIKTRIAWLTRSLSHWRGRVWGGPDELRQVISQEITK